MLSDNLPIKRKRAIFKAFKFQPLIYDIYRIPLQRLGSQHHGIETFQIIDHQVDLSRPIFLFRLGLQIIPGKILRFHPKGTWIFNVLITVLIPIARRVSRVKSQTPLLLHKLITCLPE